MTFSSCRIMSIGSVNSGFYSHLALSTWDSVQLGVCLLGFCPLGSLAKLHSAHVGLCPLLVLSTLDSTQVWFCLLGILSIWMFVYLDSVHLGVWPHNNLPRSIVSTKCFVNSGFCSRLLRSI